MSSQVSAPQVGSPSTPRQGLNTRQAETVEKLLAAGLRVLRQVGHEALTVRMVATEAGVSPATAYTYLASKNHLIAELFLRQIGGSAPPLERADTGARLHRVIGHLTEQLTAEPELAAAATSALLGSDPDVARLRLKIGAHFVGLFQQALADHPQRDALVDVLTLTLSGALLEAGMGLMTYPDMAQRLDAAVRVILRGSQ